MNVVKPHEYAWWDFENLDNAQTVCHDREMYLKYGYGRVTAQISVDIRNGLISRDDALPIVRETDGKLPWRNNGVDLYQIRERIGMEPDEFQAALDQFTNFELFERKLDGEIVLKEFAEAA
jgi:hypothetical protein